MKQQERKSYMAESKFAGIFQHSLAEEPRAAERAEHPAPVLKAPGRPPGKRSDPAYKQYSVLLKKHTHRQVTTLLRDREDSPDVSELLQQLLEQWLEQQKKS
jgi:hypothetical protein